MKMQFRDSGQTQEPIRPKQTERRHSKPRNLPVLRWLVRLALLALILGLGWFIYQSTHTVSKGLVASEILSLRHPHPSYIEAMLVQPGQAVMPGTPLYRLRSDAAADQAAQLRERLVEWERQAAEATRDSAPPALRSDLARRQQQAENRVHELQQQGNRLQQQQQTETGRLKQQSAELDHRLPQAEAEAALLRQRQERVMSLISLDAATIDDSEAVTRELAQAQARLAQLQQQKEAMAEAQQQLAPRYAQARELLEQQLAAARDHAAESRALAAAWRAEIVQQQRSEAETRRAQIATAQQTLARLEEQAGPRTIKAEEPLVIQHIHHHDGAQIPAHAPVLEASRSDHLHVLTWIPLTQGRDLNAGDPVRLTREDGSHLSAEVFAAPTHMARVPASMRDQLPRLNGATISLHIRLPSDHNLLPGEIVRVQW